MTKDNDILVNMMDDQEEEDTSLRYDSSINRSSSSGNIRSIANSEQQKQQLLASLGDSSNSINNNSNNNSNNNIFSEEDDVEGTELTDIKLSTGILKLHHGSADYNLHTQDEESENDSLVNNKRVVVSSPSMPFTGIGEIQEDKIALGSILIAREDDDEDDDDDGISLNIMKNSINNSIDSNNSGGNKSNLLNSSGSDIETTPVITRQQWIRILVIYSAVLSDGLSLTLVQPFLPQILQTKWHFKESQVGYASGMLIGVYSLARFFSSFYIGHMSDRFGRKPFLLLSLFSTGLGTAIFGLMPNVYLAMAVRFLEGIFSNTTALCQATLADMVDKRNRPAIFAYLGAIFALSRCLSSTMGGVIVKLAEKQANPYMYPCLSGGAIVLISCALIFFLHPETHPKFAKKGISAVEWTESTQQYGLWQGLKILMKDWSLVLLFIIGSVNSFSNGGLLLALVLFSSLSLNERGLNMDSFENGIMFSVLGLFGFLFQITFFKRLSKSFGLKRQYLMGAMMLSIGMALFPLTFIGYLIQGKALVWVVMMIVVPINSIGFMCCLPIVQGMIANASKPQLQGLTQGTSQSLNSLLRSFGPALSGAIFSFSVLYGVPWLLFCFLSIIYVSLAIISLYLPNSVDVLRSNKGKH